MKVKAFLVIICSTIYLFSCSTNKNPVSVIDGSNIESKIIGVWSEEKTTAVYSSERSIFVFNQNGTFIDSVFFYISSDTLLHYAITGDYSIDNRHLIFTNFSFAFIDTVNFNTSLIQKFYNYSKIEFLNDSTMHLFRFEKHFSDDKSSDRFWGLWKRSFWTAIFNKFPKSEFSSGVLEYSYYFNEDSVGTYYNSYACLLRKYYMFDAPLPEDTLQYDFRIFPPYFYFLTTTPGVIKYQIKDGEMSWLYIELRPKLLRKLK